MHPAIRNTKPKHFMLSMSFALLKCASHRGTSHVGYATVIEPFRDSSVRLEQYNERETDDEGIERDLGRTFTLKDVIQECEKRLSLQYNASSISAAASKKFSSSSSPTSASVSSPKTSPVGTNPSSTEKLESLPSEHYRAVMRAFVTEAQDLQLFLATVAEGSRFLDANGDLLSSQNDLDQLQRQDWAVLWKQVMLQLREGVKLKKVNYSKTPLEYTLTPYEMLMEDIRSRRYTLNKVMVNGDIPQRVKKDAHSIILDFIRSRPPLKKASERRLAPRHSRTTPMEELMLSIRQEHSLRHVQTPTRPRSGEYSDVCMYRHLPGPEVRPLALFECYDSGVDLFVEIYDDNSDN
ncbi:hypothetical protein FHG87_004063 [Trinorchestia longiramus]|nr:hypothetical protein FHG87_004063 [Trinorchestia longiramus]